MQQKLTILIYTWMLAYSQVGWCFEGGVLMMILLLMSLTSRQKIFSTTKPTSFENLYKKNGIRLKMVGAWPVAA